MVGSTSRNATTVARKEGPWVPRGQSRQNKTKQATTREREESESAEGYTESDHRDRTQDVRETRRVPPKSWRRLPRLFFFFFDAWVKGWALIARGGCFWQHYVFRRQCQ